MLDRLGYIVLSFAVCLTCVIPSSAWSYQSFVGVDNLPNAEDYTSEGDVSLFSVTSVEGIVAHAEDNVGSFTFQEFFTGATLSSDFPNPMFSAYYYHPAENVAGLVDIPGYYAPQSFPTTPFSAVYSLSSTRLFVEYVSSVPETESGNGKYAFSYFKGPYMMPSDYEVGFSTTSLSQVCKFDIDLSSYGEFCSFELSGLVTARSYLYSSGVGFLMLHVGTYIAVYVNDSLVRTFSLSDSAYTDLAHFIYSGDVPVESLSIGVSAPVLTYDSYVSSCRAGYDLLTLSSNPLTFTVLSADLGKPAAADALDSDINSAQEMEGQLWEDFSSKFNGLNVSISDGIASAASLLGGLFNDLWTTMGDVRLVYFVPLYFGLLFWILGRVRR